MQLPNQHAGSFSFFLLHIPLRTALFLGEGGEQRNYCRLTIHPEVSLLGEISLPLILWYQKYSQFSLSASELDQHFLRWGGSQGFWWGTLFPPQPTRSFPAHSHVNTSPPPSNLATCAAQHCQARVRRGSTVVELLVAMAKTLPITHATQQQHWGKDMWGAGGLTNRETIQRQVWDVPVGEKGAWWWEDDEVVPGHSLPRVSQNLELALTRRLTANTIPPICWWDNPLFFPYIFLPRVLPFLYQEKSRNNCYSPFYLSLGYCRLKKLMNNLCGILNGVFNLDWNRI